MKRFESKIHWHVVSSEQYPDFTPFAEKFWYKDLNKAIEEAMYYQNRYWTGHYGPVPCDPTKPGVLYIEVYQKEPSMYVKSCSKRCHWQYQMERKHHIK